MRRSTVPSLSLELVFLASTNNFLLFVEVPMKSEALHETSYV
jgi:hypothetical protein